MQFVEFACCNKPYRLSLAAYNPFASWSTQDVVRELHVFPSKSSFTRSMSIPLTTLAIAFKFPLHPPINSTESITFPFNLILISLAQVPFVLYVYIFPQPSLRILNLCIEYTNRIIFTVIIWHEAILCRKFFLHIYTENRSAPIKFLCVFVFVNYIDKLSLRMHTKLLVYIFGVHSRSVD